MVAQQRRSSNTKWHANEVVEAQTDGYGTQNSDRNSAVVIGPLLRWGYRTGVHSWRKTITWLNFPLIFYSRLSRYRHEWRALNRPQVSHSGLSTVECSRSRMDGHSNGWIVTSHISRWWPVPGVTNITYFCLLLPWWCPPKRTWLFTVLYSLALPWLF